METLLEDYKRRLKTITEEIKKSSLFGDAITLTRLGTKASCYRTFIAELNKLITESKIT